MIERVVLLSIPQLHQRDVTPGALASLESLAGRGAITELEPAFPGLAASSFATLITGDGPARHGIIGNTYFDRQSRQVIHPPLPDSANLAPKLWERLTQGRPSARSLLWFLPNSQGAHAQLNARIDTNWQLKTDPIELADQLIDQFGAYPRPSDDLSEPPRMEATQWILKSAAETIQSQQPDLAIVRVPYLGQIARRFGPDGREANRAILDLESALGPFLESLPPRTLALAVTESVTTPVSEVLTPNQLLREMGLLVLNDAKDSGPAIDFGRSAAFALVDHQLCHVYLNDPSQAASVASAFAGEHGQGIAIVATGEQRARLGLDHPRSGDLVLVACPDHWFCCDWWHPDEKSTSDLCSTGLSPNLPGATINPEHVKGSLGAPCPGPSYYGVVVSSMPMPQLDRELLTTRDLADLVLEALGVGKTA